MAPAASARHGETNALRLTALAFLVPLLAFALVLRLRDPTSSPVIAAEDPFTHIVYVKEWMAQGYFADSRVLAVAMYPPGFHALVGALAGAAGLDLVVILRFIAPVLGVLGVAGVFFLGRSLGNSVAGLAAAVLLALAPEHIFRSELGAPTALDLALLPWFLLALGRMLEGERAWRVPFALTGAALVVAHPWVMVILAGAGLVYLAARTFAIAERREGTAVLATAVSLALLFVFSYVYKLADDPDRQSWLGGATGSVIARASALVPTWLLVAAPLAFAAAFLVPAQLARRGSLRTARLVGVGTGALLSLVVVVGILGFEKLPLWVDFPAMLGWPLIALSLVGVALAPALRSRLSFMGIGLGVVTLPFVVVDVFGSWYLPHRTAIYLVVAAALLGGAALGALVEGAATVVKSPRVRRLALPATAVAAVALVAVASIPGAAAVQPWYRYYTEEQWDGMHFAVDAAERDLGVVIVTGSWEPNLFFKALTPRMESQVHYRPEFYADEGAAQPFLRDMQARDVYVWWDVYTVNATKVARPWFVDRGEVAWQTVDGRTLLVHLGVGR